MSILDVEHACVPELDAAVQKGVDAICTDVTLGRMAAVPAEDLSAWCARAIQGLHMWNSGVEFETVTRSYYQLGRAGASWGVPVRELIRAVILLLNIALPGSAPDVTIIDYARYYLIRGYEDAIR